MVKKMVIPTPKPEPEPTPAPARITVGEKILARMDEVLSHISGQEDLLTSLESQVGMLSFQIRKMDETFLAFDGVLAKMQEGIDSTRNSANEAEIAAEDARKEVERLTEAMPDVEEVVQHIRSQERIEWLASLKPAF